MIDKTVAQPSRAKTRIGIHLDRAWSLLCGGALVVSCGSAGSSEGGTADMPVDSPTGAANAAGAANAGARTGSQGAADDSGSAGGPHSGGGSGGASQSPGECPYRIAYSADGNQHDYDDHHASPMVIALLAEAEMQNCLVHFDYNNHLGDNDPEMAKQHRGRVLETAEKFGFDLQVFFDDQQDLDGSLESITQAASASDAASPLYFVLAGPMEVPWRGLSQVGAVKLQHVVALSHHSWNNGHLDTPQMTHGWSDIEELPLQTDHLGGWPDSNQNETAWKSKIEAWQWLTQIQHGQHLYDLMITRPGRGDASDAGMVFYVLTGRGNASATMNDIRTFFGVQ